MIISNNTQYIIKRYKTIYSLMSFNNLCYYKLIKITCTNCNRIEKNIIEEGTLIANKEKEFNIIYDSDYILNVGYKNEFDEVVYEFINIYHYDNLLSKLLEKIKYVLCKSCTPCTEDDSCIPKELKDCLDYQVIFNSIQLLIHYTKPYISNNNNINNIYQKFITEAFHNYKCNFLCNISNQLISSCTNEKSIFSVELFKKIISIYYLSLYFYEYYLAETEEEKEYIKCKYQFEIIKNCIIKTGIDIIKLEDLYTEILNTFNTAPLINNSEINLTELISPIGNVRYEHIFEEDNFLNGYFDNENNLPNKLKLINLISLGKLYYNNILITANNFEIDVNNISLLKYQIEEGVAIETDVVLMYQISDINTNSLYSNIAYILFKVFPGQNQPPIMQDVNIDIQKGETITLNSIDFINSFTDPEGDSIDKIKIINIPQYIIVKLNNNIINNGDIISFNEIINNNITAYCPTTAPIGIDNMEFKISDTGSGIFVN